VSERFARWSLAALLGCTLSGCKFVGATDHNLRELHNEEGMHQRTGRLLSHYGYAARVGFMGLFQRFGAKPNAGAPAKIEDPLGECVDALNELASFDSSDAGARALQVEQFSRLAVDDPWQLSREIAVHALGEIGAKLEFGPDLPEKPAGPFASTDELHAALIGLVRAVNRIVKSDVATSDLNETLAGGTASSSETTLTVDEACAALDNLSLNVEGATRVLRLAAILQGSRVGDDPRLASVVRLRDSVERRCIRIALLSALTDDSPESFERMGSDPGWGRARVQAAAVHACVKVWGEPMLAQLLITASPRDPSFARLIALMREVARLGLPAVPDAVPAEKRDALRREWLRSVWLLATDHPEGEVRVAAYAALARIAGRPRASIREEEWLDWAREAGLIEAQARPAAHSGTTTP